VEIVVIRSAKRRKTAQARLVDGRLEVRIPGRASAAEEARLVEQFRGRFERSTTASGVDLARRARRLARAHDLPEPREIRWASNQAHRWGSCTPSTGVVRISDRLAALPTWVLDHVIVHELAHLVERRHDARFAALVARYPLAERAEGFLIATSGLTGPTADPFADEPDRDRDEADGPDAPRGGRGGPAAIPLGPGDGPLPEAPRRRPRRPPGSQAVASAPPLPFPGDP
jgi:hypothetical protein